MIRHFLIAVALCWLTSAGAAPFVVCNSAGLPGYISIDPSSPSALDQITITVGKAFYAPMSGSIEVQGHTIDATITAEYVGGLGLPQTCLPTSVGPLDPGIYAVNLNLVDILHPEYGKMFVTTSTFEVRDISPGELSGLWWNSSESGWGINFTQRGPVVFAAWYTYDQAGNPKWYVAPHCELVAASGLTCTENLYEVSGPTFFGTPFDPLAKQILVVGSLRLTFSSASTGLMAYSVAGESRTVPIARQPLPSGSPPPPVNYTDLWWNPSESGWGLAITHQFNVMFLAWYVYDSAGKPTWYVSSNCNLNSAQDGCDGALYRTTGPAFANSFDPTQVHAFVAGTVSVKFSDSNSGVLTYTVNGVSSTKAITRQLF